MVTARDAPATSLLPWMYTPYGALGSAVRARVVHLIKELLERSGHITDRTSGGRTSPY